MLFIAYEKTTLIKVLSGLIYFDSGKIELSNYNMKKKREEAVKLLGVMLDKPALYDFLSGRENLLLQRKIRGISFDRIEQIIKEIGLSERIDDKVGKYSTGMKQRLNLGIAILHNPKILILDEPFNGLDPQGIKDINEIILKMAEQKTAVLISSHLLLEIKQICKRMLVLVNGHLNYDGSFESLQTGDAGENLILRMLQGEDKNVGIDCK